MCMDDVYVWGGAHTDTNSPPPTLSDKNIDLQKEVYPLPSLFSLEHKWKNKIIEGSREGSNIFTYTEQDFPIKTQTDNSNSCEKNGPFSYKG